MKKVITILLSKIVIFLSELIGRGSTFPGKFARKLDKDITNQLIMPKLVIAVTGSSGKGSTSSVIAKVFKDTGHTIVYNDKGSNVNDAIITTLLKNCKLNGLVKKDVGIFEIDERYAKYIFPYLKPNYVVITNITRDQPPRQGHYDLVFNEIKKALTNDMHLIINSDDPYLYKFNTGKNKITYYGVGDNVYSKDKNEFFSLNMVYCPDCGTKLNYNKYYIESIGDFKCPNCSFKRIKPSYEVTKMDFDNKFMLINKKDIVYLKNTMLYNIYNTLAAYTACSISGLEKREICEIISNLKGNPSIYSEKVINDRKVYILNNKNENSSTFNQSLNFIDRDTNLKTIIIGWREISRRYPYNDLSWLYDIDFEILKNHQIDKIICAGTNKYDIAACIKQIGIDEKKIFCFSNLEAASDIILNRSKGNIYAVLNFDYVEPFNKIVGGKE